MSAAISPAPRIPEVSRAEILRRLDDPALKLVNALPRVAFDESHIPGSISLPVAEIRTRAREVLPDLSSEIVVYCGGFD